MGRKSTLKCNEFQKKEKFIYVVYADSFHYISGTELEIDEGILEIWDEGVCVSAFRDWDFCKLTDSTEYRDGSEGVAEGV